MKKIVFALSLIAGLATPAAVFANGIPPKTNPTGPTREEVAAEAARVKQEAAREKVVPAAELKVLTARWNSVSLARNTGPVAESNSTDALAKSTWTSVNGAITARGNRDRAGFDNQVELATKGMNDMCAVLSGC